MNKKLERLVIDLNEELFDKESVFDEYPLIYTSSGCHESIEFMESQVYSHEEHMDWKEFQDELLRIKYVYERLNIITRKFFAKMTNEEIEEKYGIGIEEE